MTLCPIRFDSGFNEFHAIRADTARFKTLSGIAGWTIVRHVAGLAAVVQRVSDSGFFRSGLVPKLKWRREMRRIMRHFVEICCGVRVVCVMRTC